ncbi:MAG: hypothetical protein QG574_5042 [Cyanobacteriota bacterium erpe_2018_sw_21hr_WHONDRS-SW48-000092_B_bin.40]|nr:hypothetical protein [Cyanobacteriota bacterium erpe_2018_sw_21hr_WHONDRS-SW48-000092_B_bin.40]
MMNRSKNLFALSLLGSILAQSCSPLAAFAYPQTSLLSLSTAFGATAAAGEPSAVVKPSVVDADLNQPLVVDDQASVPPSKALGQGQAADSSSGSVTSSGSSSTANSANAEAEPQPQPSEIVDNNQTVSITQSSRQRFNLPANGLLTDGAILKGGVSEDSSKSPIIQGVVQALPTGTKVSMISQCYLNSQLSQTGDAVTFRIAHDIRDGKGNRVVVPGDWIAHGFVTQATKPGRNGVPGRVDVKISKIVSPDGNYELPFQCKISSADNKITAVSKLIYRDAKFATVGAVAGSILSVQMTGIGTAVATHGISVGIGAAAGATFGAICAAWRKGDIAALSPNDELKLVTSEPIELPGFNPVNLPSAAPKKILEGLQVSVAEHRFEKNDFTADKSSRLLYVKFSVVNNSDHDIDKKMLRVVSNKGVQYHLDLRSLRHRYIVPAKGEKTDTLCFNVDLPKNKYYLVLLDSKGDEFKRVPIN